MLSLLPATIHEHLHEAHIANDRTDNKQKATETQHVVGVVALVEGEHHLGPSQTLWRHGFHHVDLSCSSLPRSLQFLGLCLAEDRETPLNVREGRVVIAVCLVLGRGGLASTFEAGQDNLFPHSVLGGDVQDLRRRPRRLAPERVACSAIGEGIDDVAVGDVG